MIVETETPDRAAADRPLPGSNRWEGEPPTEPMRRVSFGRKRKSSANFRKSVKSSRRESFMSGRT